MLESFATGIFGIIVLSLAWLGVQLAWRRVFPGASADADALAGRLGCHGCGCTDVCEERPPECTGRSEEERHE